MTLIPLPKVVENLRAQQAAATGRSANGGSTNISSGNHVNVPPWNVAVQGNMPQDVREMWMQRQEAQERFAKARSDLDEALSQRSQTPLLSTRQLQQKDAEIEELRKQLDVLQAQIQQKDIRIQQQAETIHVHSQEMSRPRADRITTPQFRGYSEFNNNANAMQGPPPAYNQLPLPPTGPASYQTKWGTIVNDQPQSFPPPRPPPGATFPGNNTHSNQSPRQGRGNMYRTDDQGSPLQMGHMNNLAVHLRANLGNNVLATPPRLGQGQQGLYKPGHTPSTSTSSGQGHGPPAPPQSPFRPGSAVSQARSNRSGAVIPALVPYIVAPKDDAIVQRWKKFFDMVIKFAYDHVNVPSNHTDSRLPQALKNRLMAAATKFTAARLLSTQNTRFLLIGRVMLEWIGRFVFGEDAFVGLDQQTDRAITATRSKIFNDTPAAIKFVFLQDIAGLFQKLRKHANYRDFANSKSHERATQLWDFIRPLKVAQTDGDWQDMHNLMQEAHKIAELQLCDVTEYRLFFNNANDSFDPATMINMDDQYGNMSDDDVVNRKGSVRLGVVPQVMSRITSADGEHNSRVLLKAGVLLGFKDHMIKDLQTGKN